MLNSSSRFLPRTKEALYQSDILCGILVFVLFSAVADERGEKSSRSLRNFTKFLDAVTRQTLREKRMAVTVVDEFVGDLKEWTKLLPEVLGVDFDAVVVVAK